MRPSTRIAGAPNAKGFEYVAVTVVVLILSFAAIPSYRSSIRSSQISEATSRLGQIIVAAEVYAQGNSGALEEHTWPRVSDGGLISLSDTKHFHFEIVAGAGRDANITPFTVRAFGIAGTTMEGVTVSITVPNIRSTIARPVVTGL